MTCYKAQEAGGRASTESGKRAGWRCAVGGWSFETEHSEGVRHLRSLSSEHMALWMPFRCLVDSRSA